MAINRQLFLIITAKPANRIATHAFASAYICIAPH